MGKAFDGQMTITIDQMTIERREAWDDQTRKRNEYRFTKAAEP